jgi:hypothetical protein
LAPIYTYGGESQLRSPHFLLFPASFFWDNVGQGELDLYTKAHEEITRGCRHAGKGHPDYELWQCPAKLN